MTEYNAPPPPPRREGPTMSKVSMFVRAEQRDALRDYAQRHDSSFAAVVRQAFDEYLTRRGITASHDEPEPEHDAPSDAGEPPRPDLTRSDEGFRPGVPWDITGSRNNPNEQP